MSSNIRIVELSRPALSNPVLIQGLPGLGFVGKIAVDFLIDQLKPTKIAEMYSPYMTLPDGDVGVKVELNSTFTLPSYEFYAYAGKSNAIFLTADAQPSPWGQYNVAWESLNFAEGYGCKSLIALGGYALQRRNMDVVYAVANEPNIVEDLGKRYNVLPAQSGMIKGAFGIMLGVGKGRGIKCTGLLGSTAGAYPDVRSSRNVVRIIAEMFGFPVDLSEIDKKVEDIERRVEQFRIINVPNQQGEERAGSVPRGYIT